MPISRPTQAVILAGGRGIRLRPLTDTVPKPLIPIHGRPFLSYLFEQVKDQGISDVLVLVGYLGEQIREFCRDGTTWGLRIRCAESPVEAETGQRLMDAASLFAPSFLLMYCDNYWPMNLDKMYQAHQDAETPAMVTVYCNRDGFTRNNVTVDDRGRVTTYDPDRSASGLNGVEIGYALLTPEVLNYLPQGNIRFEHVVYPALSARGLLGAYQTDHRYYGVGSFERLSLTEAFLEPQRAVILDRDGVLNERPPRAQYVRSWEDFRWLPHSVEALQLLNRAGYKLILASNQPGIARGHMTEADLGRVHRYMEEELAQAGITLDAIYYCPHGWDDGCFCRKPMPGMLFQAQKDFHLDLTKTLFVGDDERDQKAGVAAGCLTALVSDEVSLLDVVHGLLTKEGVARL